MKKFVNAVIYGHKDANEILVDKGVIKAIGRELGSADEVIDLGGKLVIAPYVDPHLHLDYVYTLSELGRKELVLERFMKQLKCGQNSRRS